MIMLKCKIEALTNSKREGDHWDFKEKTHENDAAPLQHILSLSKSLYKGERYLIFGVADPNDGCTIKGSSNGEVNQKNQTDFIDFIRAQEFAGDVQPLIELNTLVLEDKIIDVLPIFDTPNKPYYLTSSYRDRNNYFKGKWSTFSSVQR